jgi:hypothetical protein
MRLSSVNHEMDMIIRTRRRTLAYRLIRCSLLIERLSYIVRDCSKLCMILMMNQKSFINIIVFIIIYCVKSNHHQLPTLYGKFEEYTLNQFAHLWKTSSNAQKAFHPVKHTYMRTQYDLTTP